MFTKLLRLLLLWNNKRFTHKKCVSTVVHSNSLFIFYLVYLNCYMNDLRVLDLRSYTGMYKDLIDDVFLRRNTNSIQRIWEARLSNLYNLSSIFLGLSTTRTGHKVPELTKEYLTKLYLSNSLLLEHLASGMRYDNVSGKPFGGFDSAGLGVSPLLLSEYFFGIDYVLLGQEYKSFNLSKLSNVIGYRYRLLSKFRWKKRRSSLNAISTFHFSNSINRYNYLLDKVSDSRIFYKLCKSVNNKVDLEDSINDFYISEYDDFDNREYNIEVFYKNEVVKDKLIFDNVFEDLDTVLNTEVSKLSKSLNVLCFYYLRQGEVISNTTPVLTSKLYSRLILMYLKSSAIFGLPLYNANYNCGNVYEDYFNNLQCYFKYREETYYLIVSGIYKYTGIVNYLRSKSRVEREFIEFDSRVLRTGEEFSWDHVTGSSRYIVDYDLYKSYYHNNISSNVVADNRLLPKDFNNVSSNSWDVDSLEAYSYENLKSMFSINKVYSFNHNYNYLSNLYSKYKITVNVSFITNKLKELKYFLLDRLSYVFLYVFISDKRKVSDYVSRMKIGNYKNKLRKDMESRKNAVKIYKFSYNWYEELVMAYSDTVNSYGMRYDRIGKYSRHEVLYNLMPFRSISKCFGHLETRVNDGGSIPKVAPGVLSGEDDPLMLRLGVVFVSRYVFYNDNYMFKYRIRNIFLIPGYKFNKKNGVCFI